MSARIQDVQKVFEPVGPHHQVSDITAVTPLVPPSTDVSKLLIQADAGPARYTLDGSPPSAGTGFILADGAGLGAAPTLIPISKATVVQVIDGGGGARLQYQWGK